MQIRSFLEVPWRAREMKHSLGFQSRQSKWTLEESLAEAPIMSHS
ncbi:hypothetical protein NC652_015087 [Populus alba x Populus x berolinensis]|nr:hypothetical protein NC652_015087 [Populus alba x Populus x berolinensis]